MKNNLKALILMSLFATSLFGATKKLNVVYILADDMGIAEIGSYGQKKLKTPNIDRIGEEGMKFTRHYSGATVCAPSRCTLLTAKHTGHSAVRDNGKVPSGILEGTNNPMPADTFTIAHMFKENGYVTGAFGKWGLGENISDSSPKKMGFDKFFGYIDQVQAHSYYPTFLWDNDKKVELNNKNGAKKDYSADIIHAEALKFIKENKDKPFFLYYATTLPHTIFDPPAKYLAPFKNKFLPDEANKKKNSKKYETQKKQNELYAAVLDNLDIHVGEVYSTLEEAGILDDTIIIFTSDNGVGHDPTYWKSTGNLRGEKRDLYEGGVRAPMLLRWKNVVPEKSITSHISAFWDVMPTFAEMLGAEIPSDIDGISFLPTILGKDGQKEHDYLYWEYASKGGKKAVLQGDWKLVGLNLKAGKAKYELYNLADDESEKKDLAKSNPEKLKELKEIMKSARTISDVKAFNFNDE